MKIIKKLFGMILISNLIFFGILVAISIHLDKIDGELYNLGLRDGRLDQRRDDIAEQQNTCWQVSKNETLNLLLKKYFQDCDTIHTIYAIAHAESSGMQMAVGSNDNGSKDGGFLQINSIHRDKGESINHFIVRMHILQENIALAKKVYDSEGFMAWVQYKNGNYLKFLK